MKITRKLSQTTFALLQNFYLVGFFTSGMYSGYFKGFCCPSLNCASCPAALFGCPIGMLQNSLASLKALTLKKATFILGYVVSFFLIYGVLLGRFVCGWVCPFGFLQELLYKFPAPKVDFTQKFSPLKKLKWGVLVLLCLTLPLTALNSLGYGEPWFCKYLCPAGTLEAGITHLFIMPSLFTLVGTTFFIKVFFLLLILMLCIMENRFFCKTLCPLGLIYGIFNKFSLITLTIDKEKCNACGLCQKVCPVKLNPLEGLDSIECIRCLNCLKVCPKKAIKVQVLIRNENEKLQKINT